MLYPGNADKLFSTWSQHFSELVVAYATCQRKDWRELLGGLPVELTEGNSRWQYFVVSSDRLHLKFPFVTCTEVSALVVANSFQ